MFRLDGGLGDLADDEVGLTIRLDSSLGDLFTFGELMDDEGVEVVSVTKPRVERDPAAPPQRNPRPFVIVLQGAEPAIDAAIARFRQVSDARVGKLPAGSL